MARQRPSGFEQPTLTRPLEFLEELHDDLVEVAGILQVGRVINDNYYCRPNDN